MGDHGAWHGQALEELTKRLLEMDIKVYSEYLSPELEPMNLKGKVLGKTQGKLGTSLFLERKSIETRLTKPDLVIMENDKIKHIIEIEGNRNPKKISGIIVATRIAINCDINSDKIRGLLPIKEAVLHILLKDSITPNVQAVINDIIENKGNLAEINIVRFDEFIENINDFI